MRCWIDVLRVGGRVFAVVDDGIDEVFGEDDGLDLSLEGFFEDVVLWQVNWFVCVVWRVEFGLGGQEDIVGNAESYHSNLLNENSSLTDLD